ncbi:B12-binding domain-containing radical SAM protein [Cerasicoccus fimbriatus]|uniref:B12-binding domain-containing radical SAM protein n=1 Tax=Cerasicoccus fimbriatus TaxID=3014554 RepID=UPI0022B36E3C|nr:cobalamin-dependent protein [Cerasicoccus sp. TK19100]
MPTLAAISQEPRKPLIPTPRHPLGGKARILLTSVFGPYAQDDEYGSRKLNPMELYHNQVTRTQGPFSLRMFHRSWGIMIIQANIQAPCTLLDFPVQDRFIEEIKNNEYDVIGITAITPNILKVKHMCKLIRKHQPKATIVIGGHISNIPDLRKRVDADLISRGDGVRWFREYLGEDPDRPVNHPATLSGFGARTAGLSLNPKPGDTAATLIPSVGCPLGCNFCSTSAMFGGKGKFINFYNQGDELFAIMSQLSERLQTNSFFVMDENFLFHRKRALRLLELIEEHDKAWSLYVFASANILRSYKIEQLVRLGISWVWMGIEGRNSQYKKTKGIDTFELVKELQSHGIRVLGSTIIGLEEHTPENLPAALDYAAAHDTDFHQFMLYTPIPGTALHRQLTSEGRMKDESTFNPADIHGQLEFNYHHPSIPAGSEGDWVIRAFNHDFAVNGPSILRIARTTLAGWKRYAEHADQRIVRRFKQEASSLATTYPPVIKAAIKHFKGNVEVQDRLRALLKDLQDTFGLKARLSGLASPYVSHLIKAEAKRLASGWTYEPPTFYERNEYHDNAKIPLCNFAKPLCNAVTA